MTNHGIAAAAPRLPRVSCLASVAVLALLLTAPATLALIEFSIGNDPVDDRGWPAGSLDLANLESRIALWVGPPFGGGQSNFVYRGDAAAFQRALDLFAKLEAPKRILIVHAGPEELVFLKNDEDPKVDARYDWSFTVWDPKVYDRLYNDPDSVFMARDPSGNFRKPVSPPQMDVYVGGAPAGAGIDWSLVTVPDGVTVVDERAASHGFKPDAGSVVRGQVVALEGGKPVRGARILVSRYDAERQATDEVATGTAGADGRFEITGIPPGDHVTLRAEAAGFVARSIGYAKFGNGTFKEFPTVALARPFAIEGTVTNAADGKPMAGVTVRADIPMTADGFGYPMADSVQATTDASGHFTLAGLPRGKCQIHTDSKDMHRIDPFKLFDIPAKKVALQIAATGSVRGKITKDGGAPTDAPYIVSIVPEGGERVGSYGGLGRGKGRRVVRVHPRPAGQVHDHAAQNPGPELKANDPNAREVDVKPGPSTEVEIELK